MLIEVVVHSNETQVHGVLYHSDLERDIQNQTYYMVPGHERDPQFMYGRWDGKEHLFKRADPPREGSRGAYHVLPTGLLPRVLAIMATRGALFEVTNRIPAWERDPAMSHLEDVVLPMRDYQTSSVLAAMRPTPVHPRLYTAWKAAHGDTPVPADWVGRRQPPRLGGVIQAATGAGKTRIAAKITQRMQVPTVFLVNQRDLMAQTIREFEEMLKCPIGQVGGGVVDIRPITVCTIQTVCRAAGIDVTDDGEQRSFLDQLKEGQKEDIVKMMRRARLVFLDECHGAPAATSYNSLAMAKNAACVVGLSASPWRDDGLDILIEAACGPTVYKVSASDLIEKGWLVQPEIHICRLPPAKEGVGRYSNKYHEVYRAWVVDDQRRNEFIADTAQDYMLQGHVVLILVKQLEHGKALEAKIPASIFLEGKLSAKKRKDIINGVKSGEILCLIATSLADQGLDIPVLSVLILAGGGKSSTRALQRIGRILRPSPGKNRAYVVDLVDAHPSFRNHSRERMRIYKTEPKFILIEKNIVYPPEYDNIKPATRINSVKVAARR